MKLVVDTTELFSFFNARSKSRELALLPKLDLHSPQFSLDEIKEHKSDILKRFSMSDAQFLLIKKLLGVVVKFAKEEEYSKFIKEAISVSPDPDDSDFFALAFKACIWSDEKSFKKQSKIRVLNTDELIDLLYSKLDTLTK